MEKPRKPEEVFGGTTEQILKEKIKQQGMSLQDVAKSSPVVEHSKLTKETVLRPGTEKEKKKRQEDLVKARAAREHLLLLLQGKVPHPKVFKILGQDYTLDHIRSFLGISRLQAAELLNSIPGFERVNKYGTDSAAAYKLNNRDQAKEYLEGKSQKKE